MDQRVDYVKGSRMQSDFSTNEGGKMRTSDAERESSRIGMDDTIYRYLCPSKKIGSIIGVGGDIAKQLRARTQARIRISEIIPGCDERVVTIYSASVETSSLGNEPISPAQDALFRVHEMVVAATSESTVDNSFDESRQVTARLLVPSDQIGCVIGKGGQIIQSMRNETHAQIRIWGSAHLPPCALSTDELIQITGEATVVMKALYQVASCLHDNPSRSQHSLLSTLNIYQSGIAFNNRDAGGPVVGTNSLMGPYCNYKSYNADWSSVMKEFSLRMVCPTENIGAVIGKGGTIIKQIRQESGAFIVVDSSGADEDDCVISVSSKETFEAPSRTMDAIMLLQPLCSVKIEKDSGDPVFMTRLLVSTSRIGCIIGKGGAIIKEIRGTTRASIRIFSDENVPKVASEDDELVQIIGDPMTARNALLLVIRRLRANIFESEGSMSAFPRSGPYLPASTDPINGATYANRENRMRDLAYSNYSDGFSSTTLPPADSYGGYDDAQGVDGSAYGGYTGRSGGKSLGAS